MSYFEQRNRNKLGIGQEGNTLITLIAINLIAFVILALIKVIYFFSYGGEDGAVLFRDQIINWVTLPAHLPTLITRPWTLLTHFILHIDVWHIIANMLWLWAFGRILQDIAGHNKVVPVFLYGAFAGAISFILAMNLIPGLREGLVHAKALGASAGVMAIAIAATALAPGYRIFPLLNGGIPLWVITGIFVIIDLATIPESNSGGHIAHLAGAAMGYLFVVMLRRGSDWGNWINNFFDWANNLFNPDKPKKGKTVKSQLYYKSSVPPYNRTSTTINQQRVDAILDKINQKGYNSLTEEEKEILKQASKED
jgi:membrane associated rhomboid family serine protease